MTDERPESETPLRAEFMYLELDRLLRLGVIRRDQSMLVTCGGGFDQSVLDLLGFTNVTISSLSLPTGVDAQRFRLEDAEALTSADGSFDLVLVHAGLHHCASPHRALVEMHRVARYAILVFENHDSLLVRTLCRLNLSQEYEVDAVAQNQGLRGGVRDTATPNYVYRWTRREIEKVLRSIDPTREPCHSVRTRLHFNEWHLQGRMARHPLVRVLVRVIPRSVLLTLLRLSVRAMNAPLSSQGNLLFLAAFKTRGRPLPWTAAAGGTHARSGC